MTVYFTCDQTNISNRLLSSSILRNQAERNCVATYEGGVLVDREPLY